MLDILKYKPIYCLHVFPQESLYTGCGNYSVKVRRVLIHNHNIFALLIRLRLRFLVLSAIIINSKSLSRRQKAVDLPLFKT